MTTHLRQPRRWVRLAVLAFFAANLAIGLFARDDFFLGAWFTLSRWPSVAVCLALGLASLRARLFRYALAAFAIALVITADGLRTWHGRAVPLLQPKPEGQVISVVSHNVLFRGADIPTSLSALKESKADLIALQEVTFEWASALESELASDYPYREIAAQSGTLGYALFSRFPLSKTTYLGAKQKTAFAQCAQVALAGQPLEVCNVHLYSPASALVRKRGVLDGLRRNSDARNDQWAQVKRYLEQRSPSGRHLIAGDFNTAEFDPLYETIRRDYVDSLRELSFAPAYTWPHRLPKLPGPLVRIDYIFASPELMPLTAGVRNQSGSDHLPVFASLRIAQGR